MNTTTQTPEFNSLKYVMGKWGEILNTEAEMIQQTMNPDYYKIEEVLKKQLVEFIRLRFIYLSTRELLKLCALVSRHRPVKPFSFLVSCSNLITD